ncbi:hypothetical protein CQW23_23330 [Capsicum baccatum]|uniref:Protein kinase domain-containing protein n=1 Tax=Capsicum baccatum TaxID=33114 RepID=A0A2G2VRN2_CAPBA|nr:hypothetical protein CQW23_23330 [Capsicum baccatum]
MAKKDAKTRVIRLVSEHIAQPDLEIDDAFPDEEILATMVEDLPWYADFAKYVVSKVMPENLSFHQKRKFMHDVTHYFWDEPYLFRRCADGVIRRCISNVEMPSILEASHASQVGGHHAVVNLCGSQCTRQIPNTTTLGRGYNIRNASDVCRDIAITSRMSHLKNVLKLIGCCLEYAEPVMVYEYVEEAITLDDLLSNNGYARNSSVPWESRLRIANEIASVIVFPHCEFTTPIVFRDLHSQKVLIDQSSGVAKLYDFSFSVPLPPGELGVEAQDGVRGTCGHPDPEYGCSGIVTQKTSVYSLGNVLLQLLTGKRAYVHDGYDHKSWGNVLGIQH